ncbi:MAG TPA: preprotein translocase subunit SecE [Candidatus Caccovicinus merdipullorum]|uniref:Protein translocase subunit SecE n=1 Tax=Candidatus Caccovicinus merdipullorum TaxID=2840724 RepID=A0A9D1GHD2_9FIRM|nr:preprotein translocase subunit SecE [Candidatus Caccovicinus merdipullorum]
MAENVAAKTQDKAEKKSEKKPRRKSYWKGLKAEFKKIVWPDRETVTKQTIVVLLVSLALGIIIGVMDMIFKFGINLII